MTGFVFDQAALNRMYRYCCALTGDDASAYDLLQDGLERYLRRGASRGHPDQPEAMLRRILRNRFIDLRRVDRGGRHDCLDDQHEHQLSLGFHGLDDMLILRQDLERLWARLAPLERELLHLWAVDGYTAQEVADLLGEPRGTVLSRIHRLRRRLASERAAGDVVSEAGP